MNPSWLLIGAMGYLIGTFPTAWILYRITKGGDIRDEGSGNVGARNVYEVTGKKWVGVVTFLIDALKGALATYLGYLFGGDWLPNGGWAAVGCIVGHNYNIFLKGKGGRGLATATGAALVVNPLMMFTWDIMYLIGYNVIMKNVHVGSMTATIGTAVMMYSLPDLVLAKTTLVPFYEVSDIRLFGVAMCIPLFMRHLEPIRALIRESGE